MSLPDERAYGLHLPPKERVNFLLRDHTQKQLLERPVAGYIYDIIKWLEMAENKAHRGALEAVDEVFEEWSGRPHFWVVATFVDEIRERVRALKPEEESDG